MSLSPYRPQDGWLVRRLFFILLVAFGGFSAYRAYIWLKSYGLTVRLPGVGALGIGEHVLMWGEVAAATLIIAFFVGAYYLIFLNRRASDFLVEVESELRKVSWPEYKPVGSPKAELWGSTYVVIGVVIVMTVFVGVVDMFYNFLAKMLFYR